MNSPDVVVACAWYNRAEYLRDTLDSLLNQDFDNYEIVIVNDGSTDGRVKEILDSYDDFRLRVIHQENVGFVRALSVAIESSNAPFVAIQGAGDVSHPQRLARQWNALKSNENLGVIGCWYNNVIVAGSTKEQLNEVRLKGPFSKEYCLRKNPYSHGEVMLRRSFYEQAGKYRLIFEKAQDRDLWLRMSEVSTLDCVPDILYERRMFIKDGLAASPEATVKQILLSELAVTATHIRRKTGVDPVHDFGSLAMLLRRRSLRSLKILVFAAGLYREKGDTRRWLYYKSLAQNEGTFGRLVSWVLFDLRLYDLIRVSEKKFRINLGIKKQVARFIQD